MTDPDKPLRKPLSPEEMHALVKPAEELAAQLFTTKGTEDGIKKAFDAFLTTGLMKVLKDDVVGQQVMQWADEHGIELPDAPLAGATDPGASNAEGNDAAHREDGAGLGGTATPRG